MEHSIALVPGATSGLGDAATRLLATRDAGMAPGKKRVITAAAVEGAQAPLIGHHPLTVGLLHSTSN